jgi:hypothetical protein
MKPTPTKRAAHQAWRRRRAARRLPLVSDVRPAVRADCLPGGRNAARPCPFVRCRYHLYLDVKPSGGIKLNFPDREVHELHETCALDVADRGSHTLDEIGRVLNMAGERARQIAEDAFETARDLLEFVARRGLR